MIGYRVPSKMINNSFLCEYFKLFNFIEIKVKNQYDFLSLQKNLNSKSLGRYSIHLPKQMLYNEEELKEAKIILGAIKYCKNLPINLVTHFYGYDEKIISILKDLRIIIPKEISICLENIQSYDTQYMHELEFTINELKNDDINICFDIGHFMYGAKKLGLSQLETLETLKNKPEIYQKVMGIHVHDFNYQTDHIVLSEGEIEERILSEILCILPKVPITIETTVKDAKKDGIMKVNWLKEIMNYGYTAS